MSNNLTTQSMPTIISIAESTHYLVGAVDSSNNFTGLTKMKGIETLNSLVDAKQYLRDNNIVTAALEYQTAYDEMCGTETVGRVRQIIKL